VKVARSVAEFAELRAEIEGQRIAYVATMGALHAGHRSLFAQARAQGQQVVVSIFVNPLQFGPDEDYARYPRPVEEDLEICRAAVVDLVLVPSVADLYPPGRQVTINGGTMASVLEGASRPGHFDGVLTVMMKFFHIVRPDVTVFGQKDAQQLACIQRMVTDLNLPIEVLGAPTVREPDGLALSSRNVFLTPAERTLALSLSSCLREASSKPTLAEARAAANEVLAAVASEPSFVVDYATVVNPATFAEVENDFTGPALFVVAAMVGRTRLIDNAVLTFAPVDAAETF
jgi:pantoate--beta-alanine ligase